MAENGIVEVSEIELVEGSRVDALYSVWEVDELDSHSDRGRMDQGQVDDPLDQRSPLPCRPGRRLRAP